MNIWISTESKLRIQRSSEDTLEHLYRYEQQYEDISPLKDKIYCFVSVFLLMETEQGLEPGPAGILQNTT